MSRGLGMPGGKPPKQPAGLPSMASARLLGPSGLPLEDPQPTFLWNPLSGATPFRNKTSARTALTREDGKEMAGFISLAISAFLWNPLSGATSLSQKRGVTAQRRRLDGRSNGIVHQRS